jgi:hypothetical protein
MSDTELFDDILHAESQGTLKTANNGPSHAPLFDDILQNETQGRTSPSIRRPTEEPAPEPGFLSSKVGRFAQGVAEPVMGAAQMAAHLLPFETPAKAVDRWNKARDETYQESRLAAGLKPGDLDYWAGAGNLAATAAPLARAARVVTQAPSFIGAVMRGAGMGGLGAALEPVKDTSQGYWGRKGENVALGTLLGGALGPVSETAARVALPVIDEKARWLADRGVRTTMGQTIGGWAKRAENVAESLPFVGETIRERRMQSIADAMKGQGEEVMGHVGQTIPANVEVGNPQIAHMQEALGKEFNDTYRSATLTRDRQFLRERKNIFEALDRELTAPEADRVEKLAKSLFSEHFNKASRIRGANTPINGDELQHVITGMKERERSLVNSSIDADRTAGKFLGRFRELIEDTAGRQNPGFKDRLEKVSEAWWKFARMQAAAGQSTAIGHGGVYTPTGLGSATARLDPTLRNASTAAGKSPLQDWAEHGKSVLPAKVADSGSPERGFWMGLASGALPFHLLPAAIAGVGIPSLYSETGQNLARRYLLSRSAPQQWAARGIREASPWASLTAGRNAADNQP